MKFKDILKAAKNQVFEEVPGTEKPVQAATPPKPASFASTIARPATGVASPSPRVIVDTSAKNKEMAEGLMTAVRNQPAAAMFLKFVQMLRAMAKAVPDEAARYAATAEVVKSDGTKIADVITSFEASLAVLRSEKEEAIAMLDQDERAAVADQEASLTALNDQIADLARQLQEAQRAQGVLEGSIKEKKAKTVEIRAQVLGGAEIAENDLQTIGTKLKQLYSQL